MPPFSVTSVAFNKPKKSLDDRTTRFCRTHGSLVRRNILRPCRRCRRIAGETNLDSAARRHAVSGSQGLPALPAPLAPNAARVHRKPGSQSRRHEIAPQG
jgi:hypothetical protein